jgi:hypothetical protein
MSRLIGRKLLMRLWVRTAVRIVCVDSSARFRVALSPTDGVDGPNGISVPQYGS